MGVTLAAMVTRVRASNRGMPYEALATVDVDGYVRKRTISVRPCAQLFCVRKCTQLFLSRLESSMWSWPCHKKRRPTVRKRRICDHTLNLHETPSHDMNSASGKTFEFVGRGAHAIRSAGRHSYSTVSTGSQYVFILFCSLAPGLEQRKTCPGRV